MRKRGKKVFRLKGRKGLYTGEGLLRRSWWKAQTVYFLLSVLAQGIVKMARGRV